MSKLNLEWMYSIKDGITKKLKYAGMIHFEQYTFSEMKELLSVLKIKKPNKVKEIKRDI